MIVCAEGFSDEFVRNAARQRRLVCDKGTVALSSPAFNVEMLVFSPTIFDEHALKQVGQLEDDRPVYFWLVEKASRNMRRGTAFQHDDMTVILSGADAAAGTKD